MQKELFALPDLSIHLMQALLKSADFEPNLAFSQYNSGMMCVAKQSLTRRNPPFIQPPGTQTPLRDASMHA
jgi:hypothetical protein